MAQEKKEVPLVTDQPGKGVGGESKTFGRAEIERLKGEVTTLIQEKEKLSKLWEH